MTKIPEVPDSRRLRDVVREVEPQEIPARIRAIAADMRKMVSNGSRSVRRTNERDVIVNFAKESALQLERLADWYPQVIEGVAWTTRNLFEIDVLLRWVLLNPTNCNKWLGQIAGDEQQLIEGFLTLTEGQDRPQARGLRERMQEIKRMCEKHGIDPAKPMRADKLAAETGQLEDYTALYKLFSKYVHPSSWLLNSPESSRRSSQYLNIFVMHAQLYAFDTYSRVKEWLKTHSSV